MKVKTQRTSFRPSWVVLLWLVITVAFAAPDEGLALDIYVSVENVAEGDGSLTNPYGSLPGAVEAVRALRKAGNKEQVRIILRKGRHQLNQTLVLGLEDGSPTAPHGMKQELYGAGDATGPAFLTFAAFPGENPVVSGGIPVTGWKRLESVPSGLPTEAVGKVWVADMPVGMKRFYTLYDGNGRLNRARNAGFVVTKRGSLRRLHFPSGALKNWDNLEDVEIQIRPSRAWVINMLPLASVDVSSGVATTGASATYEMSPLPGWVHNPSGANVWVENIFEVLDEPGEWVVNTKTRKIYLWPSDSAPDGSPRGILAPTTTELIRVEGAIDYDGPSDTPVRSIAFSGLTFSHADRWAWTNDENRVGWGMQHDWDMFDRPTALLRFRGAEECRVTDCRFANSGGSGVRMDLHAQRNRVIDSEFAHLGGAGILLAGYGPGTKDVNHHNDIINNFIVGPAMVPRSGYISYEWVPVPGSKVHRNIIISHPDGGKAHNERYRGRDNGGRPKPKLVDTDMDKNLYYHPTDPHWVDEHLRKMRAVGKEKASCFGDPLFVDPAGGDFSFRPGSPGLALGIEPLDVSRMGRSKPKVFNIKSHGAIGDGVAMETKSVQAAVDACHEAGGGVVWVPAGDFQIGTIILKSGVTLSLDHGATLLGSTNLVDYPTEDLDDPREGGPHCLVYAKDATNVTIEGLGVIDGRGTPENFPRLRTGGRNRGIRPRLLRMDHCENLVFSGVTYKRPAFWGLHLVDCKNVHFNAVTIRMRNNNFNNDGIDLDGCQSALIENCDINSGDDAICLKSSRNPCRDIVVRGCRVSSNTAPLKFGTSSHGGFIGVRVTDCYFYDSPMGAIKLQLVDGGRLENVDISGIVMENVGNPIFIRLGNRGKTYTRAGESRAPVGTLKNIRISDVVAKVTVEDRAKAGEAAYRNLKVDTSHGVTDREKSKAGPIMIAGIPGHCVENVVLENIKISYPGHGTKEDAKRVVPEDESRYPEQSFFGVLPAWGAYIRHAKNVEFKNVELTLRGEDVRQKIVLDDAEGFVNH